MRKKDLQLLLKLMAEVGDVRTLYPTILAVAHSNSATQNMLANFTGNMGSERPLLVTSYQQAEAVEGMADLASLTLDHLMTHYELPEDHPEEKNVRRLREAISDSILTVEARREDLHQAQNANG